LFEHLVGVLCFFIRQHSFRSKYFTLAEGLHSRVAQLMSCPQKHLKLTALKWFRTCLTLQDEFHNRQIIQHHLLEPALLIVEQTMPRDNLLNSACLELFEHISRDGTKAILVHLVETYRERLMAITYVDTFHRLVYKYDQVQSGYNPALDDSFSTQGADTPNKGVINGGQRFSQGLKEVDADEDAYFNTSDNEDEEEAALPEMATAKPTTNGASPARPLVAYPDDEEDIMETLAAPPDSQQADQENREPVQTSESELEPSRVQNRTPVSKSASPDSKSPPERLSEKRRREEDEEDDLHKMAAGTLSAKRRNSVGPQHQQKADAAEASPKSNGPSLRRKGSLRSRDSVTPSKVTGMGGISISLKGSDGQNEGEDGG